MGMKESRVLFDLSVLAVAMNLLLIAVVLKIPKRPWDINLAILLSISDLVLASITIKTVVTSDSLAPDAMKQGCRVLGPIGFMFLYISSGLVASISLERWSRITDRSVHILFKAAAAAYTVGYFGSVGAAVLLDEFDATPSGLDCTVDVTRSRYNAGMVFLLGLTFILMLIISLAAYVAVYFHISSALKRRANRVSKTGNYRALTRIVIIMFVYTVLIAPSACFLFIEALQLLENAYYTSLFASILITAVPVANPCLILFAHSLVFSQLIALFRPSPPIVPLT